MDSYFLSEILLFLLVLVLLVGKSLLSSSWKEAFPWIVLVASLLLALRESLLFLNGLSQNLKPLILVHSYFILQKSSFFFRSLILKALAGAMALMILSKKEPLFEEAIFMILAALFGLFVVTSHHYLPLYLALESLSLTLFFLVYFQKRSKGSEEGSFKFFLFSILYSLMLLIGIALIYHFHHTLEIKKISHIKNPWLVFGLVFLFMGFLGKGGFMPFHYGFLEGLYTSRLPIGFFLASLAPISILAFLFIHSPAFSFPTILSFALPMGSLFGLLGVIGLLALLLGSLGALLQESLHRWMSYLSLVLSGILLTGFSFLPLSGGKAFFLLLLSIFFWTLFGFYLLLQIIENWRDFEEIHYLSYFSKCHPLLSALFLILLLSFVPFPLLPGFWFHYGLWQFLVSHSCYWYGIPLFFFYGIMGLMVFRFTRLFTEKSLTEIEYRPIFSYRSKEMAFFYLYGLSFLLVLLFLPQVLGFFQWVKITL